MIETNRGGFKEASHGALRVVAALLFLQHGIQKLFGGLGGTAVQDVVSLRGLAGILELLGGVLLMVGLLTRPVALIVSGEMAVAYFLRHAPRGFWPILNGGELAALYCFIWLFVFANGPGAWSVDGWLRARKARAPLD